MYIPSGWLNRASRFHFGSRAKEAARPAGRIKNVRGNTHEYHKCFPFITSLP